MGCSGFFSRTYREGRAYCDRDVLVGSDEFFCVAMLNGLNVVESTNFDNYTEYDLGEEMEETAVVATGSDDISGLL